MTFKFYKWTQDYNCNLLLNIELNTYNLYAYTSLQDIR